MAAPTPRTHVLHRRAHRYRERNRIFANIGTVAKPKYGTGSDIVAINGHELLVNERDGTGLGDGSSAIVKLAGFAFGPDVDVDGTAKHTLFIANDNDYSSVVGGKSNPNQFFVFAFDDGDLAAGSTGFQPQELGDRECDDDLRQTLDRDACDDHSH